MAYVYVLGALSTSYLGLEISERHRRHVKSKIERLLCRTAGAHSRRELEKKVKKHKAINILGKSIETQTC